LMFTSGGYPWTIVRVENRRLYIEALEHANITGELSQFIKFIISEMRYSEKL